MVSVKRHTHKKKAGSQLAIIEQCENRLLFAFGFVGHSDGSFTIDTGGNTVFVVDKGGNMTSLLHNGKQIQTAGKTGHFESGLPGTVKTTITENSAKGTILVTAASSSNGLIQYYIAKKGDGNVYLDTYASSWPGEMRYYFSFDTNLLTSGNNANNPSNYASGNKNLESPDTVVNTKTGWTFSKFYGNSRMIDPGSYRFGLTGNGIGAFFDISSHEKQSGGPFFSDIQGITYYMWSDHAQIEPFPGTFRAGLQGGYSIALTNGGQPGHIDYSFYDGLGLKGYVPASGRGSITGASTTNARGVNTVVALANNNGQYWATARGGQYTITGVLPGTYTETLYQGELAVGSQTVTIGAGKTTNANIADTRTQPTAIWTIGTWDGTPLEFENGPKFRTMHPSDSRMTPWKPVDFFVGTSATDTFPAAQWKDIGNIPTIHFNLTAAQAAESLTLRIGSTDTFAAGRDFIVVNNGKYTSPLPASGPEPDARTLVHGTYRGYNHTWTYTIPAGVLVSGANTISLHVNAGTGSTQWLSPSIAYDAIDLVTTASLNGGSIGAAAVARFAAVAPATTPASVFSSTAIVDNTIKQLLVSPDLVIT
ncbi:MAG: polysaccharide lyase family protein [Planctomycetota bacterium]|nr:polysaccharide lyase family protein [Planctomycetota bacterium]